VASDGEKKEETEFTRIVSWNKLAELCSQLLAKGRKVYVEGRLQTRSWETPDGQNRQQTEVVIVDMRILDSKKVAEEGRGESLDAILEANPVSTPVVPEKKPEEPMEEKKVKKAKSGEKGDEESVDLDDLPF